jgi:hypothetical protein
MQEAKKSIANHQELFQSVCHAIDGGDSAVDRHRRQNRFLLMLQ